MASATRRCRARAAPRPSPPTSRPPGSRRAPRIVCDLPRQRRRRRRRTSRWCTRRPRRPGIAEAIRSRRRGHPLVHRAQPRPAWSRAASRAPRGTTGPRARATRTPARGRVHRRQDHPDARAAQPGLGRHALRAPRTCGSPRCCRARAGSGATTERSRSTSAALVRASVPSTQWRAWPPTGSIAPARTHASIRRSSTSPSWNTCFVAEHRREARRNGVRAPVRDIRDPATSAAASRRSRRRGALLADFLGNHPHAELVAEVADADGGNPRSFAMPNSTSVLAVNDGDLEAAGRRDTRRPRPHLDAPPRSARWACGRRGVPRGLLACAASTGKPVKPHRLRPESSRPAAPG